MGTREVQQRLRLSRQRIQQLTERADFPRPCGELAMGRVWLACEVEAWIHTYRPRQANTGEEGCS
nr:AlpA family phage regulatory protein [Actinoplanes regularis]